jgi:hypothetical protein
MDRRTRSFPIATGAPAETAGLSPRMVRNSRNSISSKETFLVTLEGEEEARGGEEEEEEGFMVKKQICGSIVAGSFFDLLADVQKNLSIRLGLSMIVEPW